MGAPDHAAIALELADALAAGVPVEPLTARYDGFDLEDAYEVLDEITALRESDGWVHAGRKIGFTNTTLWEIFGVDAPMWAPVWDRTFERVPGGRATVDLGNWIAPRIEPEVAFGLSGPIPITDDAAEVLPHVEWMAPAFEIVQCLFPGWSFQLPDATASFGLHGRLVVGAPVEVTAAHAASLVEFEAMLSRDGEVVDRGVGANALGSPALALVHLARVVAAHPGQRQLVAGEVITTGTLTNAFPVAPGETWRVDYGTLGLAPLEVTFQP